MISIEGPNVDYTRIALLNNRSVRAEIIKELDTVLQSRMKEHPLQRMTIVDILLLLASRESMKLASGRNVREEDADEVTGLYHDLLYRVRIFLQERGIQFPPNG